MLLHPPHSSYLLPVSHLFCRHLSMSRVLKFGIFTVERPKLSWKSKFKFPHLFESNQVSFSRTPFHKNNARLFQTEISPKSASKLTILHSLTVSYLVESCGFSLDSAISVSKKVKIRTPEKTDSVLQLLRTYGFTEIQITNLITQRPQLLLSDPDKTLKPKFEFYESLGFSRTDLAKQIVVDRNLLLASLEQRIIPNVNFIKILLHTNENIIAVIKRTRRIVYYNLQTNLKPNIAVLRGHGVPDSSISKLLLLHARTFTLPTDLFKEAVTVVGEIGFDPQSLSYILALRSMLVMSKTKWVNKLEVFTSFGWSKHDFVSAFKLQPLCVHTSEKKIRIMMDLFVNKLGVKPSHLAKYSNLFTMSLEKRIIPRCSVLEVLLFKGLIDKDRKSLHIFLWSEKCFHTRFVSKYKEIGPEVVEAYDGKMGYPNLETLRSMF